MKQLKTLLVVLPLIGCAKKITFVIFLLAIVGCSSMPGGIAVDKSNYDGTVQVKMQPAFISSKLFSPSVKMGIRKNSQMKKDDLIMIVRHDEIKSFASGENFLVKIDEKETKFSPIEKSMDCEVGGSTDISHCYAEYIISRDFAEKMAAGKDVKVRLFLRDGIVDDEMTCEGYSCFKPSLKDFLKKLTENGL